MSEPRVWYNQKKKERPGIYGSNFGGMNKNRPGIYQGVASTDAAHNEIKRARDAELEWARSIARHSANPNSSSEQTWTQQLGVQKEHETLGLGMTGYDDEIHDRLGLPPELTMDMVRNNPTIMNSFPHAKERFAQWHASIEKGQNRSVNEDSAMASDALGWMKDKLLDVGIKVGQAFELLWKPAEMGNEQLEKWFPEDSTGTRRFLGMALGATVIPGGAVMGSQEGFMPRLPTPKQLQSLAQDSMADLGIGDPAQIAQYRKRFEELKLQGLSDDEAKIQAFEERTDIPGWVKFALPVVADPFMITGIPGAAKGIAKGAAGVSKGLTTGFSASGRSIADEAGDLLGEQRVELPTFRSNADLTEEFNDNTGKLAGIPILRKISNLIDPSKRFGHLVDGSHEKTILTAKLIGASGQEMGAAAGPNLRQQMQGIFGNDLGETWGAKVANENMPVDVVRLREIDYSPLNPGSVHHFDDGTSITKHRTQTSQYSDMNTRLEQYAAQEQELIRQEMLALQGSGLDHIEMMRLGEMIESGQSIRGVSGISDELADSMEDLQRQIENVQGAQDDIYRQGLDSGVDLDDLDAADLGGTHSYEVITETGEKLDVRAHWVGASKDVEISIHRLNISPEEMDEIAELRKMAGTLKGSLDDPGNRRLGKQLGPSEFVPPQTSIQAKLEMGPDGKWIVSEPEWGQSYVKGVSQGPDPHASFRAVMNSGEVIARDFPDFTQMSGHRVTPTRDLDVPSRFTPYMAERGRRKTHGLTMGPHQLEEVPLADILTNPHMFQLNNRQQQFADTLGLLYRDFKAVAKAEDLDMDFLGHLPDAFYYSARLVKGVKDEAGNVIPLEPGQVLPKRAGAQGIEKPRIFEEMADGVQEGWVYADVYETLDYYTQSFYRAVSMKRMEKVVEEGGLTRSTKVEDMFPDFAKTHATGKAMMASQFDLLEKMKDFRSMGGTELTTEHIDEFKDAFKHLDTDDDATRALKDSIMKGADDVLGSDKRDVNKALLALREEGLFGRLGVSYQEVRDAMMAARQAGRIGNRPPGTPLRGNVTAEELRIALRDVQMSDSVRAQLIEETFKKSLNATRGSRDEAVNKLIDDLEQLTPGTAEGFYKLEKQAENARRSAARMGPGETTSRLFPGKVFVPDTANNQARSKILELDEFFLGEAPEFLKATANANAFFRYVKTNFDVGAPLIQGLPILFNDPKAWGTGLGHYMRSLNPANKNSRQIHSRYVADNARDITEFMSYGMHLGSSELTEAGMKGGWFAALPNVVEQGASKIGLGQGGTNRVGQGIRNHGGKITKGAYFTGQRMATGFDVYLDVARVEIMKGLKETAMASKNPPKSLRELADFANKMTGMTSTKAMGVGTTQRAIESSILMFSPRYTRAVAALFMDMSRGGTKGRRAQKAIAALFAGQVALHTAAAAALGQEPNLMPGDGKFLKVQIGDTMVGFGGKANALMNMAGDVAEQVVEDPEGFMSLKLWSQDTYDSNSFLKRLRYQMSPVGGEAISWLTGADPIGRTLPDVEDLMNPATLAGYVGDKMLPFAVDAAWEGGSFRGAAAMGEFGGGITMPVLPYMEVENLRDKYSKQDYGMPWDKLKKHPTYRTKYAAMKELHPDLAEAITRNEETARHFHRNKDRTAYQDSASRIRKDQIHGTFNDDGTIAEQGYTQIAEEYNKGVNGARSGEIFREKMAMVRERGQGAMRELRRQHPELVKEREEYFAGEGYDDVVLAANNEFFDFLNSPRAKDQFGNVNHEAITRFTDDIQRRYGETVATEMRSLREKTMLKTPDGVTMPQLVIEYYESWDTLEPYWKAYKDILPETQWAKWQTYSDLPPGEKLKMEARDPQLQAMKQRVDLKRDYMRMRNYEMDKALGKFYDYAPKNPRWINEVNKQQWRMYGRG